MFTTNYIVFKFSFIFLLLESNFILYLPPLLIFCFPQTALFVFDFYFISHFTVDIFSFVLFWVRRQLYHFPFFFLLSFSVFLLFSDMSQPLHLILLSFFFHLIYCILSLFCYRTQLLFFLTCTPTLLFHHMHILLYLFCFISFFSPLISPWLIYVPDWTLHTDATLSRRPTPLWVAFLAVGALAAGVTCALLSLALRGKLRRRPKSESDFVLFDGVVIRSAICSYFYCYYPY